MIKLVPKFKTTIPVFAENISPDKFSGKLLDEIKKIEIFQGNQRKFLSDLFEIYKGDEGNETNEEILIIGDVSMVREIGKNMTKGKISIDGMPECIWVHIWKVEQLKFGEMPMTGSERK